MKISESNGGWRPSLQLTMVGFSKLIGEHERGRWQRFQITEN